MEFYTHQNYLYRLNYLFGLNKIHPHLSNEVLEKELGNICKMVKDPVPNVRMNVVHTLLIIFLFKKNESVEDKITKIVNYLQNDQDHYIASLVKKVTTTSYNTAAQAILSEEQ